MAGPDSLGPTPRDPQIRRPELCLIVAMDHNRLIGSDNDLPWRLPNDLKRFKRLTMGSPIVMGRKTYESIGRPLPGRLNVVLSRNATLEFGGVEMAKSLEEALALAGDSERVFVIGGAGLFESCFPRADRFYLTVVHGQFEGDVHFPEFSIEDWVVTNTEHHSADDRHDVPYSFFDLERGAGNPTLDGEPKGLPGALRERG